MECQINLQNTLKRYSKILKMASSNQKLKIKRANQILEALKWASQVKQNFLTRFSKEEKMMTPYNKKLKRAICANQILLAQCVRGFEHRGNYQWMASQTNFWMHEKRFSKYWNWPDSKQSKIETHHLRQSKFTCAVCVLRGLAYRRKNQWMARVNIIGNP